MTREQKGEVVGYIVFWRVDDEVHSIILPSAGICGGKELLPDCWRRLSVVHGWREGGGSPWRCVTPINRHKGCMKKSVSRSAASVAGYYTDTKEDALIMWVDLRSIPRATMEILNGIVDDMNRHKIPKIME